MDKNKDGKLSLDEILATFLVEEGTKLDESIVEDEEAEFKTHDSDGDGLLTPLEASAMWFPEQSDQDKEHQTKTFFEGFDENQDGKVTVDEYTTHFSDSQEDTEYVKGHKDAFGILDRNGDG